MLERLGYQVTTKTSALERWPPCGLNPTPFDLVITDLTMPVMDGAKLAGNCCKSNHTCPFIVTTGYSGAMTAAASAGARLRGC